MPNIWFTSDTHYGHGSIIRHCRRPFASVREMDEALIAGWNACVGRDDEVYHLGDFAFHGAARAGEILDRLAGRKHLVHGNHDPQRIRALPGWTSVQPYLEIGGRGFAPKIVLCHYAMRVWNKHRWGAWMLFGHSHGGLPGDSQSMDVGVDVHGYRPVSLKELATKLKTLPARYPDASAAATAQPASS